MMGGSGGGSYTGRSSEDLVNVVRTEGEKAAGQFEVEVAQFLSGLLARSGKDTDLVRERLDEAKDALSEETESSFDTLFGGSVAKRTYVDGLSDIDALLVINGSMFGDKTPSKILDRMQAILREKLPKEIAVDHGRMAVTVKYPDGMEIQLLPAIREETVTKVPSARHAGWSHIEPDGFRQALSRHNELCGGKLVPTIKLAKAVIANMPEQYRLSGYHVESLAIAAFKKYDGKKTTETMLPLFFEKAKNLVLAPIRDSTGQSVHVDGYLGGENSELRQNIGHLLGNIAKRMRNASIGKSLAQWGSLFNNE
ncbi:MAG TPA: CBASS oligonucleotide cyclase [Terriglobales bacterium]|nr:CBASS oligonucleotide cyclase [Terriglobales bacterium]